MLVLIFVYQSETKTNKYEFCEFIMSYEGKESNMCQNEKGIIETFGPAERDFFQENGFSGEDDHILQYAGNTITFYKTNSSEFKFKSITIRNDKIALISPDYELQLNPEILIDKIDLTKYSHWFNEHRYGHQGYQLRIIPNCNYCYILVNLNFDCTITNITLEYGE